VDNQLRQVTDPGAELIVLLGIDGGNARADFFTHLRNSPLSPSCTFCPATEYQPGRTLK